MGDSFLLNNRTGAWRSLKIKTVQFYSLLLLAASLIVFFCFYRITHQHYRPVRVGIDQAPPYQTISLDGKPQGVSVDMIGEAARRLGIQVTWVATKLQPGAALSQGVADLWPALAHTARRDRLFHFTEPWLRNDYCLITLRKDSSSEETSALSKEDSIAHLPNSVHTALVGRYFPLHPLIERPSREEILKAVCRGEANAGFTETRFLDSALLNRPPGCESAALRVTRVPGVQRDLSIVSTQSFAPEADAIRTKMNQLAAEGLLAASLDRWALFSSAETQSIFALERSRWLGRELSYAVAVLLALLLVMFWQTARKTRAERRYQELFELNPYPAWIYDLHTLRFVDVNEVAVQHYGYSREQFLSMRITDIRPAEDVLPLQRNIQKIEGHKYTGIWRHIKRDGTPVWAQITSHDVRSTKGKTRLVIAADITEQKRQREELEQAKEAAESAAKMKSIFLANMSHEIRTPMNGVIGMTSLLQETTLNPEQCQLVEAIRSSGESLLEIISDVLDFSKIEAGKLHLEQIDFDLYDICEECLELAVVEARQKAITIEANLTDRLPDALRGDPLRIRQVLLNLLSNAVKFTEAGSVILRLSAETADGQCSVKCTVEDTGIGISREAGQRLFHSFTQADSSTTRQFGGSGLGLTISKRLVDLMGGEIGFDSQPGQGSRFWFTLKLPVGAQQHFAETQAALRGKRVLVVDDSPIHRTVARNYLERAGALATEADSAKAALQQLQAAAEAARPYALAVIDLQMPEMDGLALAHAIRENDRVADTPLLIVGSYRDAESAEQARQLQIGGFLVKPIRRAHFLQTAGRIAAYGSAARSSSEKRAAPPSITKKVLLVEDNPANQQLALLILSRFGCEAKLAQNGREAIEAWQRSRYDLILMDCQMPEMDGFTATREIRKREGEGGEHIPIVALTANALEEERQKCFEAGMDDHLSKPFRKKDLGTMLEKWSSASVG
jgi:PAS domain S-box-containing protein